MQQQQRWTSTWPKGLNCTLQEPYYLLSLVLLTLMRISRDKMPKDSEENMYLISKGILAVWSSQIYMGYALLTKKRVKRWIIDLYRIINWLRIVMATKTARSFIFYLLSEMYPSGMSFLWTCYPELFFFPFLSSCLSGSSPDTSCQAILPTSSQVIRSLWVSQWFVLWRCQGKRQLYLLTMLKPGLGNWEFVFVLHNKWST